MIYLPSIENYGFMISDKKFKFSSYKPLSKIGTPTPAQKYCYSYPLIRGVFWGTEVRGLGVKPPKIFVNHAIHTLANERKCPF